MKQYNITVHEKRYGQFHLYSFQIRAYWLRSARKRMERLFPEAMSITVEQVS